jgi:hypothetical protein
MNFATAPGNNIATSPSSTSPCNGSSEAPVRSGSRGPGRSCLGYLEHAEAGRPGRALEGEALLRTNLMLGKLPMIGAVAAILVIPTAPSAQMGGAIILASTLGAPLIPARPFVVPSSEVSLARIWGRGATRAGKFIASIVRPLQSSADDGADRHGQTSVLVGYRSGAKGRWIERSQAQPALGCFARRRYSACDVDSCRSFYFVGQPTMMSALT